MTAASAGQPEEQNLAKSFFAAGKCVLGSQLLREQSQLFTHFSVAEINIGFTRGKKLADQFFRDDFTFLLTAVPGRRGRGARQDAGRFYGAAHGMLADLPIALLPLITVQAFDSAEVEKSGEVIIQGLSHYRVRFSGTTVWALG